MCIEVYMYKLLVCTDTLTCLYVWECVQNMVGSGAGVTRSCVNEHLSMTCPLKEDTRCSSPKFSIYWWASHNSWRQWCGLGASHSLETVGWVGSFRAPGLGVLSLRHPKVLSCGQTQTAPLRGWFLEMKFQALIRLCINKDNQTLTPLYCHLSQTNVQRASYSFEEICCHVWEDQAGHRSQVWASVATRKEEVGALTTKHLPMRQTDSTSSTHVQRHHILSYHIPDYRLKSLRLWARLSL